MMTNTTIETVNEFVIDLKSSNDEIKKVMGMLYYNSLKNNLNLNSIDEILFEFLNKNFSKYGSNCFVNLFHCT